MNRRPRAQRGRRNFSFGRLFPVRSLITPNAGNEIVSDCATKAARRARNDVPKIGRVRVVPVNCGQFRCRIDVEVPYEVHDPSQGWRGHACTAKYEPATQALARCAVIDRNACVGVRIEGKVRRRADPDIPIYHQAKAEYAKLGK
jgi:hypothetical protein